MPNWCSNELIIQGTEAQVKSVQKYLDIEEGHWDFNKIVPCPPELLDSKAPLPKDVSDANVEKYGAPDWWHWCINNWGTKWSVDINFEDFDGHRWVLDFESAWSPPDGVVRHLCDKFPDVDFSLYYREGGCCFKGELIWIGGELVRDESWEWNSCNYCGGECPNESDDNVCDEYAEDPDGYYDHCDVLGHPAMDRIRRTAEGK